MLPVAGLETQCKSIIEGRQEREGRGEIEGVMQGETERSTRKGLLGDFMVFL